MTRFLLCAADSPSGGDEHIDSMPPSGQADQAPPIIGASASSAVVAVVDAAPHGSAEGRSASQLRTAAPTEPDHPEQRLQRTSGSGAVGAATVGAEVCHWARPPAGGALRSRAQSLGGAVARVPYAGLWACAWSSSDEAEEESCEHMIDLPLRVLSERCLAASIHAQCARPLTAVARVGNRLQCSTTRCNAAHRVAAQRAPLHRGVTRAALQRDATR
jgi:hypothetical protein